MANFLKQNAKATISLSVLALVLSAPAALAATVNVKNYGAMGNGVTDDTAAIQRAINAVKGTGGIVQVPAGTYMIDPGYNTMGGNSGLLINGAMTLQIDPGATLQAKTTTLFDYSVVSVLGGSNITITGGGTISGDKATHASKTDFGGFPLQIQFAKNVTVDGITVSQATGDGVMIRAYSSYITLNHVVSTDNSRQGLSIIDGNHISILNSTFKNTSGLPPACGIDIEPDHGFHVDTVLIQNSVFTNNDGCGISLTVAPADVPTTSVTNIIIDANTVTANGRKDGIWMTGTGININNTAGTKVTNNVITSNYGEGLMLGYKYGADNWPAASTYVAYNKITYQLGTPVAYPSKWSGGGIYLWSAPNSILTANTVTNNATNGIVGPTTGTLTGGDPTIAIYGNQTVNSNGLTP